MVAAFKVPIQPKLRRNFRSQDEQNVTVDHGEFEATVDRILRQTKTNDVSEHWWTNALAVRGCPRGGKSFMLRGVASMLVEDFRLKDCGISVLYISLNEATRYKWSEDADAAILSRIAWELTGQEGRSLEIFQRKYKHFKSVALWLMAKESKIILLIDGLNSIPPNATQFSLMNSILDALVMKPGCALIYSTNSESIPFAESCNLVFPKPKFLSVPRIVCAACFHGLMQRSDNNPSTSYWPAILRGRLPALAVQPAYTIRAYAGEVFKSVPSVEERIAYLKAFITGELDEERHGQFRSYAYTSERCENNGNPAYAWPPFMVAQRAVLGKDCGRIRSTMEGSDVDEPKAFTSLVQLAVLVRLLAGVEHPLVPANPALDETESSAFEATELFYLSAEVSTVADIAQAISDWFCQEPKCHQVVAVPASESFLLYDFFVLHRHPEGWAIAAGYQCSRGLNIPNEEAYEEVSISVWVEGSCRFYQAPTSGEGRLKMRSGWTMMGESNQHDLLGVSISTALFQESTQTNRLCSAEMSWKKRPGGGKWAYSPPKAIAP